MSPQVLSLAQESSDRLTQLAAKAQEAEDALSGLDAALAQFDEAHAALTEVDTAVTEMEGTLKEVQANVDSAVAEASEGIKAIATKATETQSHLEELQATVDERWAEVVAGLGEHTQATQEAVTASEASFETLLAKIAELEEKAGAQIDEAKTQVDTFRQGVEAAKAEAEEKAETLSQGFDDYLGKVEATLETLVKDFEALLQSGTDKLEELEKAMGEHAEGSKSHIDQKLAEEAISHLGGVAGELVHTIESIGQFVEGPERSIAGQLQGLLKPIDGASDLVQSIEPVIHMLKAI